MKIRTPAIALAAAASLAGCQTLDRAAFSEHDLTVAGGSVRMDSRSAVAADRFLADVREAAAAPGDGVFDLLALSSGAANGAFGAGVLIGWSERGDRPVFEVVTGVSIGALIAPFAFVGRGRDPDLQRSFTDGRTANLLQPRWVMAIHNPGLFRTAPLRALIESAVDADLLREIAEGHRAGRRLYVATTSIDTREQVIWDMGALAASDEPEARQRFVDILTAAASVPGAFPPVLLDVGSAAGRRVRELHTDGRLVANFFVAPEAAMGDLSPESRLRSQNPGRLWVIINGSPVEPFDPTPESGLSLASRNVEAMLNASTRLSLIAAAQFAERNDLAFAAAAIESGSEGRSLDFEQGHMNRLFEAGRRRALTGDVWTLTPAASAP